MHSQPVHSTVNTSPAPGVAARRRGGGGGGLPRDVCKSCLQKGHWANQCPEKVSTQPAATNNVQEGVAYTREVHSTLPSSEAYLEIAVNGKTWHALIDTGSDRSLMPRRLVPTATLMPSSTRLYAANGSEIANLGTLVLRYEVAGHKLETKLVVSDEIDELIFGFDWLVANDSHWHFAERTIYIRGRPAQLRVRQSRVTIRRIYVRDEIVVMPDTEVNVPVSMPYMSLHC